MRQCLKLVLLLVCLSLQHSVLIFTTQAVADSSQGFINGILWCGLSLAIWQRCFLAVKKCFARFNLCCQKICGSPCCRRAHSHSFNASIQVPSLSSSPLSSFVSNVEEEDGEAVEKLRY